MIASNQKNESRFPFTPFPDGIFAVAFSHEVRPKQVISITFMGEKLALFRTETGEIGAIESYCPHLGGDLACGSVKKDFLQCPFHGLRFKKDGSSLQGGIAGKYQVNSWHAFEQYGLVFLTYNPLGNHLNIHFPEWNLSEWGTPVQHSFKIRSHPQEILENSVDQLHFYSVHKYLRAENVTPFQVVGTEFLVGYDLERREGMFGRLEKKRTKLLLRIHAYGLGLSIAEVHLPQYGLEAKQVIFPMPIDGDFIHIRSLTSIKIPEKFPFIPNWMLPRFIRKPITNYLSYTASKGFLKDFLPDLHNWENKKYIANPNYLPKDGDFEKFRSWASQFYRNQNSSQSDPIEILKCIQG